MNNGQRRPHIERILRPYPKWYGRCLTMRRVYGGNGRGGTYRIRTRTRIIVCWHRALPCRGACVDVWLCLRSWRRPWRSWDADKGKAYRIEVRALMFGPVWGVGEGLGAVGMLTKVRLFSGVRSKVDLQVFQPRKRLLTSFKLKNNNCKRESMV